MLLASVATGCAPVETPPAPPLTVELSFPDGAPPLNQEAELNCIVTSHFSLENMSVEIRLPEGLELVSGELFWFGDVAKGDEIVAIEAVVRAVKIGNWAIELNESIDPEEQGGFGFIPGWREAIYVSVFEDSAKWATYPPWYEGGSREVAVVMHGDPFGEIMAHMSISRPPLLNETAELICTLSSRTDFPNIRARIVLPEAAVLVDGNLEWQGALDAGVPVHFLAKIAFQEPGNWRIDAVVRYWRDGESAERVCKSLYMIIGLGRSAFGGQTEEDLSDLPPPPSL